MKQEIKDRLKKCSKIAMVLGGILLWIVSFIGISAYSVYWLRQNVAYQQENTHRDLKPKNSYSKDTIQYGYSVKSQDFLFTTLSYVNNTNSYKSYWDVDFANFPQVDSNAECLYMFGGDFQLRLNSEYFNYDRLIFDLTFTTSQEIILNRIYFYSTSVSGSTHFVYRNNTIYNSDTILIGSITTVGYNHVVEHVQYGLLEYYFNKVYDSSLVYQYTFNSGARNLPQYLNSYNRLQYGQILYAENEVHTDSLTIPCVFVSNGVLYDNITFLYRPCWYYYNSAGQLIDNWAIMPYSVPYVCTHVLFGYYGKTLSWTWDNVNTGVLTSVDNGSLAMFLGYNGFSFNDDTGNNYTFWAPNYLLVQGLQVNTDYQDIYIMDVDNVPFPNSTGNDLKPYNNLSIKNILETYFNFYGDVGGYNGAYYDVGLGGVFTLLSGAFQSLIPLMAIQIIPGITLGLLVLLPLVVTIILVIIRLVKK